MGCDIHLCSEQQDDKGNWFNTDYFKFNRFYSEEDPDYGSKYERLDLYRGRDYALFTALCGVRDYSGESPKISEPRGIPEDSCQYIQDEAKRWADDGHSHSYVTLQEIANFMGEGNFPVESGLITIKEAEALDTLGIFPTSWCQGASDTSLVHRTWIDDSYQPLQKLYDLMCERYKEINWGRLPADHTKFRIVFWFDN